MTRGGTRAGAGRKRTRLLLRLDKGEYDELEAIAASLGLSLERWALDLLRIARMNARASTLDELVAQDHNSQDERQHHQGEAGIG